jgi:membrane protease subunit HflK
VVPEARGEAERILQGAEGFKQQTVAEAQGQTARFLKVYDEYKKAPEVTRKRIFLETMERVMGGTDKVIIDSKSGQGVVPYLPLDQLQQRRQTTEGGN